MSTQEKVIICDLDGTMFDIDHRLHFLDEKQWDAFWAACVDDTPNAWCVALIKAMKEQGYRIYYVTGRNEVAQAETIRQLRELDVFAMMNGDKLFMRPRDNRDNATAFKQKLLNTELASVDILFVVEDGVKTCEMWRENGLTVLQCDANDY
jgi:hydroxymethylpyrimidine pyrophosphatase-like HAD family hydrolase